MARQDVIDQAAEVGPPVAKLHVVVVVVEDSNPGTIVDSGASVGEKDEMGATDAAGATGATGAVGAVGASEGVSKGAVGARGDAWEGMEEVHVKT